MVRGIPAMMIFKDGKLIDSKVGGLPKNALIEWINKTIS
jgi:thioredoxin 1